MIIVCSNCGQNMEGTADLLNMEVKCPNCMEWTYPTLPKASAVARPGTQPATQPAQRPPAPDQNQVEPELMGQARLDQLVGANQAADNRPGRRRRKRKKPHKDLWYVLTDSGPKGPYDGQQIVEFARQGRINEANQLRNATSAIECSAGEIPDLFPPKDKPAPQTPERPGEPQWYVQTAKGAAGPFTGAQIIAFAKNGKIAAGTMLGKAHDGPFVPAEKISGLL